MVPSASVPLPAKETLLAGNVIVLSAPALAVGAWLVAVAPTNSIQLMFQPAVELACNLIVCVPATRLMVVDIVCHTCQPPVVGTFSVDNVVPVLFLIRNWAPLFGEAIRRLRVKLPAAGTLIV